MSTQAEGFRLSPQQRHLWTLAPGGAAAFHARALVEIDGALDATALREAIAVVVARHEILRTRFRSSHGIKYPLQVIDAAPAFAWHEADFHSLPADERQERVAQLYQQAGQRHFDTENAPPLDASLLSLSPARHALILSLPALCSDAAGLRNLLREIVRAYAAAAGGEAETADDAETAGDAAAQYADLSEWQNELFESDDAHAGRQFWRARAADLAPAPALPFERRTDAPTARRTGRPADFDARCEFVALAPDAAARLVALADARATTLPVLFLAAWHLFLWRFHGQPLAVVGASFDGRNYEELEQSLGLFAKYLPVRCELSESASFADALAQIDAGMSEVCGRQESFAWEAALDGSVATLDASAGESGARERFFPVCFDFAEVEPPHEAAGATFTLSRRHVCADRFKLRLSVLSQGDGALIEIHYDPLRFDGADARRLAAQFGRLLEEVAAAPDAPVGSFNFITQEERERHLFASNRTGAEYPEDSCVHELFERQARLTPDNAAVVSGARSLSYRELDARAGRLARRLRAAGVVPDSIVGIYMTPSPEMLVGLLGVLKAGGAYLPLDPQYPPSRLAFMLEDARPSAVLTQPEMRRTLPACEARLFDVEPDESPDERDDGSADIVVAVDAEHTAYVIYTSGSTGRPKGVMVTHRGLVNYLTWCLRTYAPEAGRGSPLHSSISFDLTVTSLFAPLLAGSAVCVASEARGAESLVAELRERGGFSFVKLTPAHLELLGRSLDASEAAKCARAFVIGGEALRGETLAFWREHAPATRLINEYGPTETVVGCCVYELPSGTAALPNAVPIGRPIINTQIYLLDPELRPVPTGVAGELYVGGVGLARGYLHRPELTAERFVPHPYAASAGERLYRTGDLARHSPGGEIEFLGRADRQLKIRGFRIEAGEIESVVASHPSVAEAVVVAREDQPGDRRLVAYLVARAGEAADAQALRLHAAKHLPEYMLPAAWVWLERLPLTRNGKLDRDALPEPVASRAETDAYVAPRTEVETLLAGLWAEALRVERVGVTDNFFELGGHSLLATRIVALTNEMFQIELPMHRLLERPTVEGLASAVLESRAVELDDGEAGRILAELEQLTDDEAEALLAEGSDAGRRALT